MSLLYQSISLVPLVIRQQAHQPNAWPKPITSIVTRVRLLAEIAESTLHLDPTHARSRPARRPRI